MKKDDKNVVKGRFERIYNMMDCNSYIKNEDVPENKEISLHGFKHVETDKIDNYILLGCQSDELYEKDNIFNFWSNKITNRKIEVRFFKITGWSFMTLVKRNKFFKIQGICM